MTRLAPVLALAACLTVAGRADAVITAPLPLKNALEAQPLIFVAEVAEVLPDKPALILEQKSALKGKPEFGRIAVLMKGDDEARKGDHVAKLFERLEAGQQVVGFAKTRKNQTTLIVFADGTWFSVDGTVDADDPEKRIRWALTHAEPYLRRTFKGTSAEMIEAAKAGLAGTKEPTDYDMKEEPGFGPIRPKKKVHAELAPLEYETRRSVVQLPFIGLIAALAALFPAVFGGLALTMKRWMVFMSALGIVSLVYAVQQFLPAWSKRTGLADPVLTWLLVAGISAAAGWRAAARYRSAQNRQAGEGFQPRGYERWVALGFTLFGGIALVWAYKAGDALRFSPWLEVGVGTGSALVTACYLFTGRKGGAARNVSAETVALFALASLGLSAAALEYGASSRPAGSGPLQGDGVTAAESAYAAPKLLHDARPVWLYEMDEPGNILANPIQTPHGIVVAAQLSTGLAFFGRVECVGPDGKLVWDFGEDEKLLPVMSSPVLHDGKIYFGEGFHKDPDCRVFCLDAKTGKKVWSFRTKSHTESSPVVADGRVVIGAGNDGIYALDADTGKEVWHYAGANGLHIDGNPAVADGRVFCGSGYSKSHQVNTIFALDLKTGKEVWSERVEFSAYGSPLVHEGVAYFGIGNSTFSEDREPKDRGELLARNAADGKPVWTAKLPHTVLAKPSADAEHVYVGTKAGRLHALERKTGQAVWELDMGGPLVGGVHLDLDAAGRSEVLYVTSEAGRMSAVAPRTGKRFWDYDLTFLAGEKAQVTGTPLVLTERGPEKAARKLFIAAGMTHPSKRMGQARLMLFEDESPKK